MAKNTNKDLDVNSLKELIVSKKAELSDLKFNHSMVGLQNPMVIKTLRKDIARLSTTLSSKL